MKTIAYDPETKQWRTDYIVKPDGSVWNTNLRGDGINYKQDWKLSRFTDHVDVNKNEIYENHIIKLASGSIGVVVFENGSFVVDIKKHSEEFEFYEWPAEYFQKYDYDDGFVPGALILGDIFTTPELLDEVKA